MLLRIINASFCQMMFELLQPANLFSSTSVSSEVAGISPDVITLVSA